MEPEASAADSDSLGDRIRRAQAIEDKLEQSGQSTRPKGHAAALAWRMFTDLLAGIIVGFGLGWTLDQLLGTVPIFLIVLGLLGVAGGMRLAMQTAKVAIRKINEERDEKTSG